MKLDTNIHHTRVRSGEKFSTPEVKGQRSYVHKRLNGIMAEAYISTAWRRGSVVILYAKSIK